ncbi:nuclear pore complex protein NUP1-like [Glycine soja]|uniref:Nuclear pore complex protein NUP1 n=1 Tax=Glycine soja TaxID=3848 RepID=A0A445IQ27_GLYSO|nr:nuclear pore complex protein NUP1-like [Glycine soja]RZB88084.1 Nuclear pore complex protein NUP1 [Glycine soja]
MATEEKEKGYEGGAGGKFRKRPFRSRIQTTPYDRPPTSLRNPSRKNNNGWLSKLVDPAQRLITYSAHSLFSSLFRKRLPPPPSSETEQEARNNHLEDAVFVTNNNSSGTQQGPVGGSDAQINCSDGGGLTELEKLLKQKTFTRSEIDHLTALMRSRTVNAPVKEEVKGTEMVPSEPMLLSGIKEYPKTPALENGTKNGLVVTPHVASSFPVEDVASPAELAKSYMGSRPSKVSSSILGMQTLALREDPTLVNSENVPLKSPIMSIVPRATRHAAVHENGFVTSRSRGRSAIYNMARTPYARIYPTSTLKGGGCAVEGEPSSSSQFALNHDVRSGSKLGSVKRRSSVLDNDIGSGGPFRQIRQKSNILYSKGSCSPISGSSSSVARSGMVMDAALQPLSSMQKSAKENVDGIIPSSSLPSLPSKSSEVASKILHQLDKLVSPKEKSSELRLPIVNGNSPTKLSPSMLRGQALRSMEMVDSSKLLDGVHGNKLDGPFGNFSASAQNQKSNSQRDKVENGPLKLVAPSTGLIPLVTAVDATNPRNQVLYSAKSGDSFVIKSVSDPPPKKRAFHMSAHEDCLDLDDDAYLNGAVSSFSPVEKEMTSSTAVMGKTTSGIEAIALENPSALSVIMPPKSSIVDGEAHVGTADESRVGEKVDASTSMTSSILDPTFKPFTAATQTSFGFDKPASPNGSIVKPSFTFGDKVISLTEFMAPGAPSKDITKSGPIFGLEKVVSSKEPVADAPLVDFGSNKNVNKVPSTPFTAASSVVGESPFLKFGASFDSKLGSSISSTTVAGVTGSMPKVRESDNGNTETNKDTGSSVRASELAITSAASTLLTSSKSIFNFGHNSNQNNGSLLSSTSFSSFPPPVSNNFTSQNISSSSSAATSSGISATGNSTSMATISPATIASSNSCFSTPVVASSSSAISFFKFGSSPVQSAGLPVSSSGSEPPETKSRQDAGISGLSSTAFGASSGIFGFSSSAMTTVNSQSQSSAFGASSGSVLGAQTSFTSGFATSTQTQSVSFGSSASSSSFGLTGNPPFSSSRSSFPSSSPTASAAFPSGSSMFPSSSPATNVFNSGTSFGLDTSASSSAVNSVSSNSGPSSTLFGSSWQPSKSPFGSTFTSSSSSGFSFGGTSTVSVTSASSPSMFLSTSSASTPQFSFTPAAASTSTQPAFGSPNPAFAFGSAPVNNGEMSMEDSMAEDTGLATPPATAVYSQQPAPVQSNFLFGASTPSGGSPFQFGSQQNIAPLNPSPFQASGSLGGSFSLGTGGGDKSARRIVKVKHKPRKK